MVRILIFEHQEEVLAYLGDARIPRPRRVGYVEELQTMMLPAAYNPSRVPVPPHPSGEVKIPKKLFRAIHRIQQPAGAGAGILGYLLNQNAPRAERAKYLETLWKSSFPGEPAALLPERMDGAIPRIPAEIAISDSMRKAIDRSLEKEAILEYLADPDVPLQQRVDFLEAIRRTLLSDRARPAVWLARLHLPLDLLDAIEKSDQQAHSVEYLLHPNVAPEGRTQYIEQLAKALLPARKIDPKAGRTPIADFKIPDALMQAIDRSFRRDDIIDYLTQPLRVPEYRATFLLELRASLLPEK